MYTTQTTGTITPPDTGDNVVVIQDATGLSLIMTINFPITPFDCQRYMILSTNGITALTLSAGITILGMITTLVGGGYVEYMYLKSTGKWHRV
jgi:hypothetical protein